MREDLIEALIDALVKIGNHKRVIKETESNISEPMELKAWMVKRTLYAWGLLQNELQKDTRKRLPETTVPDEGAVRGDT